MRSSRTLTRRLVKGLASTQRRFVLALKRVADAAGLTAIAIAGLIDKLRAERKRDHLQWHRWYQVNRKHQRRLTGTQATARRQDQSERHRPAAPRGAVMEMIRTPLRLTERENRVALAASEKRRIVQGYAEGNRHERRLAAKRSRQERRRLEKA